MLPGAQGQLCQEHTVAQPTSFVPGHSYQLSADDSNCLSGASYDNSAPRGFLQGCFLVVPIEVKTCEISQGNVLGYYRNLSSLRYGMSTASLAVL